MAVSNKSFDRAANKVSNRCNHVRYPAYILIWLKFNVGLRKIIPDYLVHTTFNIVPISIPDYITARFENDENNGFQYSWSSESGNFQNSVITLRLRINRRISWIKIFSDWAIPSGRKRGAKLKFPKSILKMLFLEWRIENYNCFRSEKGCQVKISQKYENRLFWKRLFRLVGIDQGNSNDPWLPQN